MCFQENALEILELELQVTASWLPHMEFCKQIIARYWTFEAYESNSSSEHDSTGLQQGCTSICPMLHCAPPNFLRTINTISHSSIMKSRIIFSDIICLKHITIYIASTLKK